METRLDINTWCATDILVLLYRIHSTYSQHFMRIIILKVVLTFVF